MYGSCSVECSGDEGKNKKKKRKKETNRKMTTGKKLSDLKFRRITGKRILNIMSLIPANGCPVEGWGLGTFKIATLSVFLEYLHSFLLG